VGVNTLATPPQRPCVATMVGVDTKRNWYTLKTFHLLDIIDFKTQHITYFIDYNSQNSGDFIGKNQVCVVMLKKGEHEISETC